MLINQHLTLTGAVPKKGCHPERSEGSIHYQVRCFASLNMTILIFLDNPMAMGDFVRYFNGYIYLSPTTRWEDKYILRDVRWKYRQLR
jgi:hypothetical protein